MGAPSASPGSWAQLQVGMAVEELPGHCTSAARSKKAKRKAGKLSREAVERRERLVTEGINYNPCNPGVTSMTCGGMAPFTRSTKLHIKDGVVQMMEMYGPALSDETQAQTVCGSVLEQLKSAYGDPSESAGGTHEVKWTKDGNTSTFTSRFPWHGCKLTLQNSGFRYRIC